MRPIKMILTASGCPGASTLIRMVKANGERDVRIIGVDDHPLAIGRFLCDGFHRVPFVRDEERYVEALVSIVRREAPDLIFVQSSAEVEVIAKNKKTFTDLGVKVNISDDLDCRTAWVDKATMHDRLSGVVKVVLSLAPKTVNEFRRGIAELGFPENKVCIKPRTAKGSRGFRVLTNEVNKRKKAENLLGSRQETLELDVEEFIELFSEEPSFPDILLMPFVGGR